LKIKVIQVTNYRKIRDIKINMEKNITIIAGANNSGKTSLVELFNSIFSKGKSKIKLGSDDLSAIYCQEWCNNIYPEIYNIFTSGKTKGETISEMLELIFSSQTPDKAIIMPPIEVKIQIEYNEKLDDLRNFADYIMEFDPNNTCFYFIYRYAISANLFSKNINVDYEKFSVRFNKLVSTKGDNKDAIRVIKEMLVALYANSSEEIAFYSDSSYENIMPMDISSFKDLFNYHNIMAGRNLDDENSDRTRILSKSMIEIASRDEGWNELIRDLPDQIIQPIQDAKIQEKVRTVSLDTLSETMDKISKTSGGHIGNIVIDMNVTEDAIHTLLKNITCAKYQAEEHYLRESSQGLGYSNLIYIHLQLEKFKKSIDPMIVNFFVVEEPEVHMHPQMQNVFAKYLFNYYDNESAIQGLLTTHSHEVVRTAKIFQLRVLRQANPFQCNLFDLREFQNSIKTDKDLLEFYDWFYSINFPDLIFADRIVMYEGDTERMYIKSILCLDDFEALRNQYISFVQVGGAYAYNYRPIIDFLCIKTVLITDLDYDKVSSNNKEILESYSTNTTINKFAETSIGNKKPTVKTLYEWQAKTMPIVIGNICLSFQGESDGFSRTLEGAMLATSHGISVLEMKSKDEWKEYRKESKLKFTIPEEGEEFCINTIVLHTSHNKTDFMYSVIINNLVDSMLPAYIKEALLWLKQQ